MKWNIEAYLKQIDIDYSYALAKRMEKFRTNAELGYRTAGSAAEIAAGKMICAEMKKIGLKKVRRDRIKVDSWEFRKAELRYTDKTGKVKKCILGGYQRISIGTGSGNTDWSMPAGVPPRNMKIWM